MDGLVELLGTDWSRRVGWSLLHFIWQGAIIAGLLWLTLRLLARSRQQARYAAACLAMLFMAAAPIVTFFVVQPAAQELSAPSPQPSAAIYSEGDSWGKASPTMPPPTMFDQYAAPSTSLPDAKAKSASPVHKNAAVADNTKQPADEGRWTARISPLVEPAMPYAVAAWLAGVLLCSLWHLGGWLKVQRLRRRGVPLTNVSGESHWLNVAQRLAETLRLGRAVRLLKLTGAAARDLAGPVVVGILRPTVMIPATVLTGLEPQQVEAILAHELAHIRRHDYLVNLLQALIETLLFYHPAVWWTSTRIRAERENCCDDLAAAAIGDSHAYAASLAALAEIVAMKKTSRPAGAATRIAPAAGGASAHVMRHARNAADRITSDRITSGADRIAPGAADNLLSRIRRLLGVDVCTSPRWTAALAGALVLTGLLTGVVFYGCGSSTTSDIRSAVGAGAAAEKNTPPQKHAAPAVSQTIQQRKESFIAATPQMQYSFVRPDGVIVELAAVSAAPSEDNKWWLPDGSPVTEPLHRLIDGREPPKIHPPGNSFAILVRNIARTSRSRSGAGPIVHLYDRHDYQMVVRVEPKQVGMRLMENYFDDHSRTEDDRIIGMRDELRICSQSFEPAVTRADVKVGLTVGQWKTMGGGGPQSRGSTGTGEREVRYGYSPLYLADTTPGGEEVFGVTVSHQLAADQQVRVMAVLKDGTEIISRSSAMSDGKLGQINATFHRPGLKMDDIKSFKLQARPLEWVEFKNVALRPEDDAHAVKQPLDIFSRRPPLMVRLYPDDDQKAGLYAIGLYVRIRFWPFDFLYKSAVEGEYVAAGNNELVGRLEGAFDEGDTFYVAEPVLDGDAIKVLVRYVRGEATKEPGGGAATGVKRAYLWGILRPDLPAGQYKVIVELVEHVRQNGKLIVAPKAANRAYERLTCEFEGSQANSAVGERAAGEKYDDAFAALIRQAIAARPAEGHSRRGADQNPTGLDLAALLKLSGQDNDLVEYPENAPAAKEGVARLKEARKIWALAGLLDHEHVDVKILAARALGEIADARSAAVLLAAAKANYYDVRGSENATLHMIYRSELREALGKVTGLDVKPHRGGLVLPGEVALERVERWLKEKFLPEEVGWGMTVNGLRARLICDVKQVIVGQPVPARLEIQCVEGIPEKSGRVQLFPHFDLWWDAGPDYGKRPLQHVTIKLPIENRNVIRKGETFKHEFDLAKALEIKAPDRYRVMAGHFNSLVSDLGDWTGDVRSEWVSFDVLADTPEQRAWVKEAWEFSERLRKLTIEELADRIVVKSEFSPGEHLDIRPVFRKKFANASPQMQAKIIKLFADQVIRLQVKQWEAPGTLHDRHHLIHYLADMGARAELLAILERQNGFDCCAAPAMIDGVVACGQPEDAWLLARKIPEISGDGGYVALHEAIQKLTDMKAEIPEAANNTHQAFRARNLAHARMWAEKLTSAGIGKADTLYFAIDDTWEKLAVMLLKEGTLWYEYGLTKTGPGGEESYDVSWRFLPVGGKQWVQFDIKQSMSQLRDLAVSPDRKRLAMLSSGEGHQMLDIFNLPALLEKRSGKPLHTVDPYPGGIWIVGWEGGLLRVSSDMPLSLPARDENGRILPVPYVDPVTLMMDEPREYLFDAATGKFTDVSEYKTPTPPTPSTPPATDAISQLSASLLPDWVEQVRVIARRQRAARNLQAIAQAMSVYAGPLPRHLPTVPQYRMRHFAGHWSSRVGRLGSDTGSAESPRRSGAVVAHGRRQA